MKNPDHDPGYSSAIVKAILPLAGSVLALSGCSVEKPLAKGLEEMFEAGASHTYEIADQNQLLAGAVSIDPVHERKQGDLNSAAGRITKGLARNIANFTSDDGSTKTVARCVSIPEKTNQSQTCISVASTDGRFLFNSYMGTNENGKPDPGKVSSVTIIYKIGKTGKFFKFASIKNKDSWSIVAEVPDDQKRTTHLGMYGNNVGQQPSGYLPFDLGKLTKTAKTAEVLIRSAQQG